MKYHKFKIDYAWVKGYIEGLGYNVIEDSNEIERVEFDSKEVFISSRTNPETRLYTILHEYGHIEIYENDSAEFESDYPMYYKIDDGRVERSKACRVSMLAEEIEAWKRGRWLARKNGIRINEEKYDKHMTKALMSYINWAADK